METVELAYDVYECQDTHSDLLPIVVLHGMFWNKYMYRELGSKLCQKTKRKVYCLDLRNHGKSPFTEKFDIYVICDDVKRFLSEHGIKKATLITHSFSCTVSYLIAIQQKELFYKKLVHDLTKDDGKFKWKTNTDFLNKEILEENTLKLKKEGFSNHEILFVRCQDSYNITDSRFEEILKFCPNSRLITIEDTTHLLLLEKVDEFVNAVTDFLGPVCNSEDRI
ncbi:unnamed protein product [Larinioides sclopetarius]|uniref:sn-1-specific diacylglycerol lipase ABHD11 n=1 Tax=Larinioides sclopetarius TaxID=280406 RepID=A0AAV1ZQY9_9ARAC